jgi:hypothetical protein
LRHDLENIKKRLKALRPRVYRSATGVTEEIHTATRRLVLTRRTRVLGFSTSVKSE